MHLLPFFGERRKMTSIGTPEIRRFIADRQSEERDDDGKITKRAAKSAEINRELAALRRSFNLAVQAALVHDMRRSAVRTFERAGVPRSVAMSIVGHKTESIYRRYAIADEAMQRQEEERLDARHQPPPATHHRLGYAALLSFFVKGRRRLRPRHGVSPAIRHVLGD